MDKSIALKLISKRSTGKEVTVAAEFLVQIAESDGLPNEYTEKISEVISSNNAGNNVAMLLFRCLIPETVIPDSCLKRLLRWVFSKERDIAPSLKIQCYRWFLAILRNGLCDQNVFQPYYLIFTFELLKSDGSNTKLAATTISIIYYLSKPEDASKFYINKFIEQRNKNPLPEWNALLSLFKSYDTSSVPEDIGVRELRVQPSDFDVAVTNAIQRNCRTFDDAFPQVDSNKSEKEVNRRNTIRLLRGEKKAAEPVKSVTELKLLCSLSSSHLSIPKQTISFLSSVDGFHRLAFSDYNVQVKFTHSLLAILDGVFLKCIDSYLEVEKKQLLNSIYEMENTLQQGIRCVNRFLAQFLQIWDGFHCKYLIYKLLEWFVFESIEEWHFAALPLQMLFRSSNIEDRCLLLQSITGLARNMITTFHRAKSDKPLLLLQDNEYLSFITTAFPVIAVFVEELLLEILAQDLPIADLRRLLTESLDFYHYIAFAENFEDLSVMTVVPGFVVYACLVSDSPIIIERLCSLLSKYGSSATHERIRGLGITLECAGHYEEIKGYILDIYRVLFSNLNAFPRLGSRIFSEEFLRKSSGITSANGVQALEALRIDKNPVWWVTNGSSVNPGVDFEQMKNLFPSVIAIKEYVESNE